MYFLEPDRTEFDLSFRIFGVSVRVHPMFWLLSAFLGWGYLDLGFEYIAVWIGCVFVSVLVHELGHVFMGRFFGTDGHIVLYSFGGLAIGSNALARRRQRIAVSFAGPLAGFLFLGLLIVVMRFAAPEYLILFPGWIRPLLQLPPGVGFPQSQLAAFTVLFLFEINFFWGVLNLLPIWPLDGGQMSRDFLGGVLRRNGEQIALGISFVLAGILALHCLAVRFNWPRIPYLDIFGGGVYMALMFGLLAFYSFEQLQRLTHKPWREEWPDEWDRDDWRR